MGPRSQTLGLLIALAVLSAVGFLVLYFKTDLDAKQAELNAANLAAQLDRLEQRVTEKKTPTSGPIIPAMEEARVKTQEIDGQSNQSFTLKQGETAKITFANSGGEVAARVTLASLNPDGAILGLQGDTWPVKVLQITPDTKTFTYSAYTFTVLGMTSDSLTLKADFSQN